MAAVHSYLLTVLQHMHIILCQQCVCHWADKKMLQCLGKRMEEYDKINARNIQPFLMLYSPRSMLCMDCTASDSMSSSTICCSTLSPGIECWCSEVLGSPHDACILKSLFFCNSKFANSLSPPPSSSCTFKHKDAEMHCSNHCANYIRLWNTKWHQDMKAKLNCRKYDCKFEHRVQLMVHSLCGGMAQPQRNKLGDVLACSQKKAHQVASIQLTLSVFIGEAEVSPWER